jgi:hypothetical protein
VKAAALQAAAAGVPAVSCYLQARDGLLGLFPEQARAGLEVVFEGIESGNAKAVVRKVPPGVRGGAAWVTVWLVGSAARVGCFLSVRSVGCLGTHGYTQGLQVTFGRGTRLL